MKNLSEENIPPCKICGKIWKRKDVDFYICYKEEIFCLSHHGIKEFYQEMLNKADEELNNPRFIHDCKSCIFLGCYHDSDFIIKANKEDIEIFIKTLRNTAMWIYGFKSASHERQIMYPGDPYQLERIADRLEVSIKNEK